VYLSRSCCPNNHKRFSLLSIQDRSTSLFRDDKLPSNYCRSQAISEKKMSRGDQRERDRAKKLARLQKEKKGATRVSAAAGAKILLTVREMRGVFSQFLSFILILDFSRAVIR